MNHTTDGTDPIDPTDELMARLGAARPIPSDDLTSPTGAPALALRQEIHEMISSEPSTQAPAPDETLPAPGGPVLIPVRRRVRRRIAVGAVGVAAAIVAVTVISTRGADQPDGGRDAAAVASTDPKATSPATKPSLDLADIQLIAQRSGAALGHSGRATVKFASDIDGDQYIASAGTAQIGFSGDDIEMTIVFDGSDETSPERGTFTSENKTVGGEFYLLDGPVGDKHWIHDTAAAGGRGTEIFNVDPRTLFTLFSADAAFQQVGTETIDGVATRHFRSTKPVPASSLNFGLGPVGDVGASADVLDVWVGDDDVTRRLDVQLSYGAEEVDKATAPLLGKNPDGTMTLTAKDGTVTVIAKGDPVPDLPMVVRTVRSTYSVTFSDIGAPVDITAPSDATDVVGKG